LQPIKLNSSPSITILKDFEDWPKEYVKNFRHYGAYIAKTSSGSVLFNCWTTKIEFYSPEKKKCLGFLQFDELSLILEVHK
jgi:hypothetical protein